MYLVLFYQQSCTTTGTTQCQARLHHTTQSRIFGLCCLSRSRSWTAGIPPLRQEILLQARRSPSPKTALSRFLHVAPGCCRHTQRRAPPRQTTEPLCCPFHRNCSLDGVRRSSERGSMVDHRAHAQQILPGTPPIFAGRLRRLFRRPILGIQDRHSSAGLISLG